MLRAFWRSTPSATRFGVVFAGYGVLADFIHHVFTPGQHAGKILSIGFIGHILTVAGMLIALFGVIQAAAESRRRARQKGERNAARSSSATAR